MAVRKCAVTSIGYRVPRDRFSGVGRAVFPRACYFNADVLRPRDALRAGRDAYRARIALDALIALGSTSGADAPTGSLSGFAAWDPSSVDQFHGEHES